MQLGFGLSLNQPIVNGSLTPSQMLEAIAPDQALLIDSTPHYTTAEWPGFEHLLADRKATVGTLRTPRAGRCWLFDGTNDYAGLNDSNLKPTGNYTITGWFKIDWSLSDRGLVGCWNGTGYMLYHFNGAIRAYRDGSSADASLNMHTQGYSNVWTHVAVVLSGTSCTFYVNGSQFGTVKTVASSTQGQPAATPFTIGAYGNANGFNAGSFRDIRLYNVAKSAAEILAIKNQADTPGTYDTTGLLAGYWCEEESGTTGYDWSGNGRHLTLTNITQATFHASDSGVNYSDANVRGYRLSGSVYIPATSSTLAADGNALTVTGKCPQPGYAPQKVATFDGTNDYATLGARLTTGTVSTLTVSAWVYLTTNSQNQTIAGEWAGTGNQKSWILVADNGGKITFYYSSDGTAGSATVSTVGYSANTWTHVAVTYSSGGLKFYVNGLLSNSATIVTSLFNTSEFFAVGTFESVGFPLSGRMADVRVYSSAKSDAEVLAIKRGTQDTTNLLGQWPMCEGPGSGNTNTTIYDVSGNGKHLTVTNATVSSFWANASTYDSCIPNHPLKYGYTIDGSGVVVPAKLDGLLDAAGNAIGTAAGKWKSGLQNINCLPYTNPLGLINLALETSLDPTADRKTTSSSKRRRRNTSGLYDRMGARATAMSDSTSNSYFGD